MAKLSKRVLKEIVKECIVEIFSESFFRENESNYDREMVERGKNIFNENIKRSKRPVTRQSSQTHYDKVSYGGSIANGQVNEKFKSNTNKVVNSLTNDPVMSEIFKDTAGTTLQSQVSAESRRGLSVLAGGDDAAKIVDSSDPTELFSESASKWASLAFAPSIKK